MSNEKVSIEKQIMSIKECFNNLGDAWYKCIEVMNNLDANIDINDFICGYKEYTTYPFDKSFDEISMFNWIESINSVCDKKITELKEVK